MLRLVQYGEKDLVIAKIGFVINTNAASVFTCLGNICLQKNLKIEKLNSKHGVP